MLLRPGAPVVSVWLAAVGALLGSRLLQRSLRAEEQAFGMGGVMARGLEG